MIKCGFGFYRGPKLDWYWFPRFYYLNRVEMADPLNQYRVLVLRWLRQGVSFTWRVKYD